MAGYCWQSGRTDKECDCANNALACAARKECPTNGDNDYQPSTTEEHEHVELA
jgi:hypothetical protein